MCKVFLKLPPAAKAVEVKQAKTGGGQATKEQSNSIGGHVIGSHVIIMHKKRVLARDHLLPRFSL